MARWAAFIKRHHDPDAAWLTVDAGNYVDRAGNSGGCTNKCQFMITSYEDLHYDVLNIGRQEAWMGRETLESVMDTTKSTDFVSANLINVKTGRPLAKPYVIKDYGNFRIGVIGLLNEADFPPSSSLLDTTQLRVEAAIEAAKKYVPMLERKTDAVVVLAELPTAAIDSLTAQVPGISLVISTGALRTGETPSMAGNTHIVGPGSSGYSGHYAMLEFNPAWGDSVGFSNTTDFLTSTYEEPGQWQDRLAAFESAPAAPIQSTKPTTIKPSTAPINLSPTPTNVQPAQPPTKTTENHG